MVVSVVVLAILLALTPLFGIVGNNAAAGLVCATIGVATLATAPTLQPGAARKLTVLLRPALLGVVLAPLGWMLLQIAPMPLHWLSDPVWASTTAALNLPMAGSVAIDIGATLLSIVKYSGLLATALIVAASTSARHSAERMFYALTAIAAFVAGVQIIRELGYIGSSRGGASDTSGAEAIAAIGMILACSAVIHILEQLRPKRARVAFPTRLTIGLPAAAATLLLCTASITLRGDMTVLLAGSLGAGVTISIFVIRTFSLGSWGKAGIGAALFLMLLLGLLAVTPMKTDVDPAIALSSKSEISSDLMLSEVPLLGRGAGSVEDLLTVYRQLKGGLSGANATAAAVITVEMGRIFLWMFIAALAAGLVTLVRGSLIRNRDYVYAASGAGVLVAFSLAMFVSTDVLSLPASLLASATLGLAWAQARSAKENSPSVGPSAAAIEVSPLHQGPFYLDRPGLRLAFVLFGLALSAEAGWVVIPELFASVAEPDGAPNSVVTLSQSKKLENAASIALVRGDLWARSAIASATFLDKNANPSQAYGHVRDILTTALRFAPYQGHAWLTLALLADQYERNRYDLTALLKMVYYTAPNDMNLVPARTKLALRLNVTALDVELQDMIRRDLTLILRQLPNLRPALLDAYRAANPAGRSLAERMIAGIDPSFLKTAQGH